MTLLAGRSWAAGPAPVRCGGGGLVKQAAAAAAAAVVDYHCNLHRFCQFYQTGYEPELLRQYWVYREPHALVARLLTVVWQMVRLACLLTMDKDDTSRGARLRETLTALGPTFVKMGQVWKE